MVAVSVGNTYESLERINTYEFQREPEGWISLKLAQPISYEKLSDDQIREHYESNEVALPSDTTYCGAVDYIR